MKQFNFDITNPDLWIDVLKFVEENGKFDFAICTHTLEDIMNPGFVSNQISKIAKEGYIAVPSKFRELSRNIDGPYRGYIHHRYIFNIENEVFVAYPKINLIEFDSDFDRIANMDENFFDLSFYWKEEIPICYVNDNYL